MPPPTVTSLGPATPPTAPSSGSDLDMQGYTLMDTLKKQTLLLIIVSVVAGLFIVLILVFILCKVRAYRSQKRALEQRGARNVSRTGPRGSVHPAQRGGDRTDGRNHPQTGRRERPGDSLRVNQERTRKRSFDNRNFSQNGQNTKMTRHGAYEGDGFYYNMKNMGALSHGAGDRNLDLGNNEPQMLFS